MFTKTAFTQYTLGKYELKHQSVCGNKTACLEIYYIVNMEKDHCFICDGSENPAQKLVKMTLKGYPTLIA